MGSGKEACAYPAADFEALSQYVQKQEGLAEYLTPVLVGYSSGATLVYAVLAQAPGNTFAGAISLGFCPDLDITKPLCKGAGLTGQRQKNGYVFDPVPHLEKPWVALQGGIDKVCDPGQTRAFVAQVPHGKIIELPDVGHGFSVYRNWLPQFKAAFQEIKQANSGLKSSSRTPAVAVGDLPLVEMPVQGEGAKRLAVFYSGDGGWADLDRNVSEILVKNRIPVVGVNCLKYFWSPKSPDQATADLERIIHYYADRWRAAKVILVGYSFGADVLPFMAARLSPPVAEKVELVALLGPSRTAAFEFHVADWVGGAAAAEKPVPPEIRKLGAMPILCVYGGQEEDSLCRLSFAGTFTPVPIGEGHHFGGDYEKIGGAILARLGP
jgi:type IV secretory pathway VirJ component